MRHLLSAAAVAALLSLPALAAEPPAAPAATPAPSPAPSPTPAPAAGTPPAAPAAAAPVVPKPDQVVARVEGRDIYMSDLQDLLQGLPDELRRMPSKMLWPLLVDQLVDREALVRRAKAEGLDKDPMVIRDMRNAADTVLQNALVQKVVGPDVSEEVVQARYQKEFASKPGEQEVHARHILVTSEEEAAKIIAQLKSGGDFAALAKKFSSDPGGQKGGDLGWFKKGQMLPEFSAVAFSLKPGEIAPKPVHTRYGWHVVQVLETRQGPPVTYEKARDEIRQQLIREEVQKLVESARQGLKVERFNPDGTPMRSADAAEPPGPAPARAEPEPPPAGR